MRSDPSAVVVCAGRAARTARLEFQKETGVSLPPLPSEEVEEKPARQLTKAERM